MAEASFSVKLIETLITSGAEGSMIGVITLYKAQMSKVCLTHQIIFYQNFNFPRTRNFPSHFKEVSLT